MTQPFRRGAVWWADLNPVRGTEPGKIRPVLIFQDQALLDVHHPSTVIIPLTTNIIDNAEPLRLKIPAQGLLEKASDLLIDQIRAIDNKRLVKGPIIQLGDDFLKRLDKAVGEILGFK
jgi:mRNA interferase MazF